MNKRKYELSVGHSCDSDMHIIINENAYKNESDVVAEFSDYKMACLFLKKCFKVIKRDEDNIPFLYTLKNKE